MARPRVDDERREQILIAFETCVARNGLAKTTLQAVADEAGLPRPLVRYFVGNRKDMVGLLIERMIQRAEEDLRKMSARDASGAATEPCLKDLLDFLFFSAFSNTLTNAVVSELWYLAARDQSIETRLAVLYGDLSTRIIEQMEAEDLGQSHTERATVAYAMMSLAYGDASFTELKINPQNKNAMRALADVMVTSLSASA